MKQNAKDMSFNGVKDDLLNLSAMLPYSFGIGNQQFEMTYQDQALAITSVSTNQTWNIEESQLYLIWDDVRVHQKD